MRGKKTRAAARKETDSLEQGQRGGALDLNAAPAGDKVNAEEEPEAVGFAPKGEGWHGELSCFRFGS